MLLQAAAHENHDEDDDHVMVVMVMTIQCAAGDNIPGGKEDEDKETDDGDGGL